MSGSSAFPIPARPPSAGPPHSNGRRPCLHPFPPPRLGRRKGRRPVG
ncbi:hypothetical protein DB32_002983 [Sandaracinus amylolyticus]|uniref:Uncharacterized protein n=1 Tax=Sandaracinus amylolyticus TaxID=927083 RepID=A0A0F6SEV1_9BACT|nr:hypothetical protein DB32_002983 [Sandaracinus amylolyticus]